MVAWAVSKDAHCIISFLTLNIIPKTDVVEDDGRLLETRVQLQKHSPLFQ